MKYHRVMVLNPRDRGRGRGIDVSVLQGDGHHRRPMAQGPSFTPFQPGVVSSPLSFPPKCPFGAPPNFRGTARINFCTRRHKFGKFPGKPRKNGAGRNTENHVPGATLENTSSFKQHYCETCDKSFKTGDDLLLHEAEHETCGRDGCEFTAHPKIIAKHMKMQHETGLYQRIGKLYTQEDISKWIEERKKRYPTRKVVEEKKILEQEKLNRGEKIKKDDSKFNKSFGYKGKSRGKKNLEKITNRNARNKRTRKKKQVSVAETFVEEQISSIRKGVPAFLGIKKVIEPAVPEKNDFNFSDDEWESETKLQNTTKPLLNNSLGLLATLYDSNSDTEIKEEQSYIKSRAVSVDEGSGPEEVSSKNQLLAQNINEGKKVSPKRKSSDRKDHRERKRRKTSDDSNFEKRSLTLLEKLLENEIRRERNIILQCVHYAVKNNFFKT